MDRINRIEEDLQDCSVDNRSCAACRSILSILKILSSSWPGQRHWSGGLPHFHPLGWRRSQRHAGLLRKELSVGSGQSAERARCAVPGHCRLPG